MTALLIDTCTEHGVVAVFRNDELLFSGEIPVGYHNSKFIAIEIDKGLKKLDLSVKDLKYIAVTIGPGSYTGIRVGVTVAKTLAYAGKLPLVGISSLEGFVPESKGSFVALIDAKVSGAYIRRGERRGDSVTWVEEPRICPLDRIAEGIGGVKTVVTPNAAVIRPKIEKRVPDLNAEWIEMAPNVKNLIKSAEASFKKGDYSTNAEVTIQYLRKTQAEIERDHPQG